MLKRMTAMILLVGVLLLTPVVAQSEIRNLGNDNIMISGRIAEESFEEFMEATAYNKNRHYRIFIHTNGGAGHATIAIINRMKELKKRGCTFTTVVYGKAFSAGAYIFLMGDRRIVHANSHLMFHTMLQKATKAQIENGRKSHPSTISMMEQMDNYIIKRFLELTGLEPDSASARYWLYGEMPDGSKVLENSQFMSARTALAMKLVTEIIE